jgi:hypothetical protein
MKKRRSPLIKMKSREGEIWAEEIASMYPEGQLDISRAAYKQVQDTAETSEGDALVRYKFSMVAVPFHKDIIKNAAYQVKCEFIGFINSSLSPTSDRGAIFEGNYSWLKKGKNTHSYAYDIIDVLGEYGFVFSDRRRSKDKVPCIIAANLESEKIHYQTAAKQARIDITPFIDGIIKAVEKLAKKVHTFQSIGVRFQSESEQYSLSRGSGEAKTYIKDIVEMMLLPRIETVQAGGTIDTEQTQDSLWYNALPLFEKWDVKYSTDSRAHFKNCIRTLCKEHGIDREQIGIIAAPWGSMFFKGQWYDISFDTIEDLAEKGTDIVFIEKRDIVRALGIYASRVGVALVNTHGLLSDYTEDLADLADRVGAHIALLTDYDIPGLLISSKLSESVPRLGVDERMLRHFGISHENTNLVIPYTARKARLSSSKLRELVENDERFNSDDVDIDFLKYHKIEIDAILAEVGAERLWQYLQDLLEEEFPTRDYTRVINPAPDLSKHYHPIVQQVKLYYDKVASEITKAESEKIETKELKDVPGFIDVEKKEKEIDERLGKIVREDKHLNEVAQAFVTLIKERGYKIMEAVEIPKEGGGVQDSEDTKHPDVSPGYITPPYLTEALEPRNYYNDSKLFNWWNSEDYNGEDDDDYDYDNIPHPPYKPEYKQEAEKYNMRYDHYVEWQIIKECSAEGELYKELLTTHEGREFAIEKVYKQVMLQERQKFRESKKKKNMSRGRGSRK